MRQLGLLLGVVVAGCASNIPASMSSPDLTITSQYLKGANVLYDVRKIVLADQSEVSAHSSFSWLVQIVHRNGDAYDGFVGLPFSDLVGKSSDWVRDILFDNHVLADSEIEANRFLELEVTRMKMATFASPENEGRTCYVEMTIREYDQNNNMLNAVEIKGGARFAGAPIQLGGRGIMAQRFIYVGEKNPVCRQAIANGMNMLKTTKL